MNSMISDSLSTSFLPHVHISDAYDFAFLRRAGKVAGTTILNGYLQPAMCSVLCNGPLTIDMCMWKAAWRKSHTHHTATLFGGHAKGQHGITIPAGCLDHLKNHSYLRSANSLHDMSKRPLVLTAVRDPYARAVSIYRYICESRGTHAGHISFGRMLSGFGGPTLQLDHWYGTRVASTHWEPQMSSVLIACRFAKVQAIRTEPNVMVGLDAFVEALNARLQQASSTTTSFPLEAPPLQTPSEFTIGSINNVTAAQWANDTPDGGCPWQCYFETCGDVCLAGMLEHYGTDVLYLGYEVPRTIDDLWRGERVEGDQAARDIAAASNRKDECLRVCKRLQPGGVPPRPEGKTGISDRLAAGNPG